MSKVIGNAGMWLALGLIACLLGRGWRDAWLSGVEFLWPAIIGYYVADTAAGVYSIGYESGPTKLDILGAVGDVIAYVIVAALASVVLSVVVLVIRRGGAIGLFGKVAIPSYIAYDALTSHYRSKALPAAFRDPVGITTSWYVGLAAAVMTVLVIVVHVGRTQRLRRESPTADRAMSSRS